MIKFRLATISTAEMLQDGIEKEKKKPNSYLRDTLCWNKFQRKSLLKWISIARMFFQEFLLVLDYDWLHSNRVVGSPDSSLTVGSKVCAANEIKKKKNWNFIEFHWLWYFILVFILKLNGLKVCHSFQLPTKICNKIKQKGKKSVKK